MFAHLERTSPGCRCRARQAVRAGWFRVRILPGKFPFRGESLRHSRSPGWRTPSRPFRRVRDCHTRRVRFQRVKETHGRTCHRGSRRAGCQRISGVSPPQVHEEGAAARNRQAAAGDWEFLMPGFDPLPEGEDLGLLVIIRAWKSLLLSAGGFLRALPLSGKLCRIDSGRFRLKKETDGILGCFDLRLFQSRPWLQYSFFSSSGLPHRHGNRPV